MPVDLDRQTQVIGALCALQHELRLSDDEFVGLLDKWYIEVVRYPYASGKVDMTGEDIAITEHASLFRQKTVSSSDRTELAELWRVLAAVAKAHGGTLSVSTKEVEEVDADRFVGHTRLDNSGTDFYFLP